MRLSWGQGIFLTMTAFVLLMAWFAWRAYMHSEELVTENYYEQELVYQHQIDKRNNLAALGGNAAVLGEAGRIVVQLPEAHRGHAVKGVARLLRPSDHRADRELPLVPDSLGRCTLDMADALRGAYRISVDWEVDGKGFLLESDVYLP